MSSVFWSQGSNGAVEEDARRVEHHWQTEDQLEHVVSQTERGWDAEAQHLPANRRPQRDRNREDQRHQKTVAHVADHRRHRHTGVAAVTHRRVRSHDRVAVSHRRVRSHDHVTVSRRSGRRRNGGCWRVRCRRRVCIVVWRRLLRPSEMARHRLASALVAARLDAALQSGDAGPTRIVDNGRRLGDWIARDAGDSGLSAERLLDDRLLTRQMDTASMQDGRDGPGRMRLGLV